MQNERFVPVADWHGLRSLGVYALLGFYGALAILAAIVLLVVGAPLWDRRRRTFHWVARAWALRAVRGRIRKHAPLEIRGLDHVPRTPVVVVANHQSMVDLMVLYELPFEFKTMVKRNWAFTPLGFNLWLAGYPLVDPKKGAEGRRRLFASCRAWIRRGVSILVFPEGTRARDHTLLPFRRGAFDIAVDSGCDVLPIVLAGTDDLSHPSTWRFSFRPGHHMIMEFLPPIATGAEANAVRVRRVAREAMEGKLTVLRRELSVRRAEFDVSQSGLRPAVDSETNV